MAKNLNDLNELLFAQLERLSDPELSGEQIDAEVKRAQSMCELSGQIIGGANTVLKAMKLKNEAMDATLKLPPLLCD